MNLSSGGLAIAIIGAIWFLVFLPSFIKAESKNPTPKSSFAPSLDQVSTKLGDQAAKALKARSGRNILITLSLVAGLIAILSALEFATTGSGLIVLVSSAFASIAFGGLGLRNNRNYKSLLKGSLRRNLSYARPNGETQEIKVEVRHDTWQPDSVPKQTFLRTGAIDIVQFAEVVEIKPEPTSSDVTDLDEILRRRRHIG
jgi:hypothetical protein